MAEQKSRDHCRIEVDMSDLKPKGIPINLGDEEHHLLFTLNAIDDIQERFNEPVGDAVDQLTDKEMSVEALRGLVTVLINDDIRRKNHKNHTTKPELTEEEVGWMINMGNLFEVNMAVLQAYAGSLPEPDEFANPKQETEQ